MLNPDGRRLLDNFAFTRLGRGEPNEALSGVIGSLRGAPVVARQEFRPDLGVSITRLTCGGWTAEIPGSLHLLPDSSGQKGY